MTTPGPESAETLTLDDLRGRIVRHLWEGSGTGDAQIAIWDGKSDEGWVAPVGVYFARVEGAAGRSSERKLIRAR